MVCYSMVLHCITLYCVSISLGLKIASWCLIIKYKNMIKKAEKTVPTTRGKWRTMKPLDQFDTSNLFRICLPLETWMVVELMRSYNIRLQSRGTLKTDSYTSQIPTTIK